MGKREKGKRIKGEEGKGERVKGKKILIPFPLFPRFLWNPQSALACNPQNLSGGLSLS